MTSENATGGKEIGDVGRKVLIAMDGSEHSFYAFDCEHILMIYFFFHVYLIH